MESDGFYNLNSLSNLEVLRAQTAEEMTETLRSIRLPVHLVQLVYEGARGYVAFVRCTSPIRKKVISPARGKEK